MPLNKSKKIDCKDEENKSKKIDCKGEEIPRKINSKCKGEGKWASISCFYMGKLQLNGWARQCQGLWSFFFF